MFRVTLGTGIRLGFDISGGAVHLLTKGGAEQPVYVNTDLGERLSRHINDLGNGALLRPQRGQSIDRHASLAELRKRQPSDYRYSALTRPHVDSSVATVVSPSRTAHGARR